LANGFCIATTITFIQHLDAVLLFRREKNILRMNLLTFKRILTKKDIRFSDKILCALKKSFVLIDCREMYNAEIADIDIEYFVFLLSKL